MRYNPLMFVLPLTDSLNIRALARPSDPAKALFFANTKYLTLIDVTIVVMSGYHPASDNSS